MFLPDPNFSIPDPGGSKRFLIPDLHQRIQVILTQKIVSKFSKILSGMFIPDPDLAFNPSRIQGSKRHWIPDPGPQH
jgi:hypothetical protein